MSSYIQVLLTVNRFRTVYKAVRKYNHTHLLKDVYHEIMVLSLSLRTESYDSILRLRLNLRLGQDIIFSMSDSVLI